MIPLLQPLDLVRCRPIPFPDIRVGDVIIFNHPEDGQPVIHRVILKRTHYLKTRGDNRIEADPFTLPDARDFQLAVGFVRGGRTRPLHRGWQGYLRSLIQYGGLQLRRMLRDSAIEKGAETILQVLPLDRLLHLEKRIHLLSRHSDHLNRIDVLLGNRRIGFRSPDNETWHIKAPYKYLISRRLLDQKLGEY